MHFYPKLWEMTLEAEKRWKRKYKKLDSSWKRNPQNVDPRETGFRFHFVCKWFLNSNGVCNGDELFFLPTVVLTRIKIMISSTLHLTCNRFKKNDETSWKFHLFRQNKHAFMDFVKKNHTSAVKLVYLAVLQLQSDFYPVKKHYFTPCVFAKKMIFLLFPSINQNCIFHQLG